MTILPADQMTARCWRFRCRPGRPCRWCAKLIAQVYVAEHIAWFTRTGHCGGCGQPGVYCLCTVARPCGCRDLHPMGSGVDADPAAVFAVDVTVSVDDQQEELF